MVITALILSLGSFLFSFLMIYLIFSIFISLHSSSSASALLFILFVFLQCGLVAAASLCMASLLHSEKSGLYCASGIEVGSKPMKYAAEVKHHATGTKQNIIYPFPYT